MAIIRDEQGRRRHSAGAPKSIGGQWAPEDMPAAATSLESFQAVATDDITLELQMRQRALAIAEGLDYVPPATQLSSTDPRRAAGIEKWHTQAKMTAEYDTSTMSAIPLMPEDFDSAADGRSVRNRRRTPRIGYADPDGSTLVRMYSVSKVRKYAEINGPGHPFDLPVEIEIDGQRMLGHARVVSHGRGLYSVQPLNFPPEMKSRASEAVTALLEARRPKSALAQRAKLAAEHERRTGAAGVQLMPVTRSSFITRMGYNRAAQQAVIEIDNGKGATQYMYDGVDPKTWATFRASESTGAAYNSLIKRLPDGVARGSHRDLSECDTCHSSYVNSHECLVRLKEPRRDVASDRTVVAGFGQWLVQREKLMRKLDEEAPESLFPKLVR